MCVVVWLQVDVFDVQQLYVVEVYWWFYVYCVYEFGLFGYFVVGDLFGCDWMCVDDEVCEVLFDVVVVDCVGCCEIELYVVGCYVVVVDCIWQYCVYQVCGCMQVYVLVVVQLVDCCDYVCVGGECCDVCFLVWCGYVYGVVGCCIVEFCFVCVGDCDCVVVGQCQCVGVVGLVVVEWIEYCVVELDVVVVDGLDDCFVLCEVCVFVKQCLCCYWVSFVLMGEWKWLVLCWVVWVFRCRLFCVWVVVYWLINWVGCVFSWLCCRMNV